MRGSNEGDEIDGLTNDMFAACAAVRKLHGEAWPREALTQNEQAQAHLELSLRELVADAVWDAAAARIAHHRQTWLKIARRVFASQERQGSAVGSSSFSASLSATDAAEVGEETEEAVAVGSSMLLPHSGLLLHVWRDKRSAHTYVCWMRRLWKALFETRLCIGGVSCPFSVMYLAEGTYFSMTALPPLQQPVSDQSDELQRFMVARLRKALLLPPTGREGLRGDVTRPLLAPASDGRYYIFSPQMMRVREHQLLGFQSVCMRTELLQRFHLMDVIRHVSTLQKEESVEHVLLPSSILGTSSRNQTQSDAVAMLRYLKEEAVPELVRHLLVEVIPRRDQAQQQPSQMVQDQVLSGAFHKYGVNMVLLYFVYRVTSALSGSFPGAVVAVLQRTIRTEMVGRVLKEIIREDYAMQPQCEADRLETCRTMYKLCLNRSVDFWSAVIEPALRKKYNLPLDVQWGPELFSATGAMFCVALKLGTHFEPQSSALFRPFGPCCRQQTVYIDVRPPRQVPFDGLLGRRLTADEIGEVLTAVAEKQKPGTIAHGVFLTRALVLASLRRSNGWIPRCRQTFINAIDEMAADPRKSKKAKKPFGQGPNDELKDARQVGLPYEVLVSLTLLCDVCGQSQPLQDRIAQLLPIDALEHVGALNTGVEGQLLLRMAQWQVAFDPKAAIPTLQRLLKMLASPTGKVGHAQSHVIGHLVLYLEKAIAAKSTLHKGEIRDILPFVVRFAEDIYLTIFNPTGRAMEGLRIVLRLLIRGFLRSETARRTSEAESLATFVASTCLGSLPIASAEVAKSILAVSYASVLNNITEELHPLAAPIFADLIGLPSVGQLGLSANVRRLVECVAKSEGCKPMTAQTLEQYLKHPGAVVLTVEELSDREKKIDDRIEAMFAPPLPTPPVEPPSCDNCSEPVNMSLAASSAAKSSFGATTPSVRDLAMDDPFLTRVTTPLPHTACKNTFSEPASGRWDVKVEDAEAFERVAIVDEADATMAELYQLAMRKDRIPSPSLDHDGTSNGCCNEDQSVLAPLTTLHPSGSFSASPATTRAQCFLHNTNPYRRSDENGHDEISQGPLPAARRQRCSNEESTPLFPTPPSGRCSWSRATTMHSCRASVPSTLLELPAVMRRPGDLLARTVLKSLEASPRLVVRCHLPFRLPYLTTAENASLEKKLLREGLRRSPRTLR